VKLAGNNFKDRNPHRRKVIRVVRENKLGHILEDIVVDFLSMINKRIGTIMIKKTGPI